MNPAIYLAGKIRKNDWRRLLVPNIRGHLWSDGAINANRFTYTGPFFVSCDHGCAHGRNTHGAVNDDRFDDEVFSATFSRADVIRNNMASLAKADLVFVYITATDCFGTLFETGWAIGQGKCVVICFAPEIDPDEFWFGAQQAQKIHRSVRECCLPEILASAITVDLPAFLRSQKAGTK